MVMDINQIWWACLTVETETPRETNSGISAVIRVVLPLPLHPARPKIRIISCPQTSLGAGGRWPQHAPKPDARIFGRGSRMPSEGAPCGEARPADSHSRLP